MNMTGRTYIVRVVDVVGVGSGRGVVERVGGDSTAFTSGQQLLDIVFGGGTEDDVELFRDN